MTHPIIVIIGMAIVTVLPRIIPAFIVERLKFPQWVNYWLSAVPYAALGALIFPGILTVVPDQPWIGLVGGLVAIILSIFRFHMVIIVLGAAFTVFLLI